MPRLPRLFVPGGFYHVTSRGNHRQKLFTRPADRRVLDGIVADALEATRSRLHAYCWMTNHLHLLIQVSDQPLGNFMQRIGTRFARAIQRQVPTTGHLFENRYHALLVDVDAYFLELLRYIHLNPVRARMVESPDDYRWSSHGAFTGRRPQSWVTTDFGLSMFDRELTTARRLYSQFVHEGAGLKSEPKLREGHPKEKRVLGDDNFLSRLDVPLKPRNRTMTLEALALQLCAEIGVSLDDVRSRSQSVRLSRARGLIGSRAIDQHIASLSEVARYLNRSASALSRAIALHRHFASLQT